MFLAISMPSVKDPSLKPGYSRPLLTILFITLVFGGMIFHQRPHTIPHTLRLSPCGHIILVSAARHGSTWLISSAEGCTARNSSTFGGLNQQTELWVDHGSHLADISATAAVDYVQRNKSLKVMPLAAKHPDLRTFFRHAGNSVPVFVLRRRLEDAYASLREAKETSVWMSNNVDASDRGVREIVRDDDFVKYTGKVERFFRRMEDLMSEEGLLWDSLDYDEVSAQRVIVGQTNGCYIRNCNFL